MPAAERERPALSVTDHPSPAGSPAAPGWIGVDQAHDGGVLGAAAWRLRDVAGLLVVPDGRYLLQLRDDRPSLRVADHWCLFGGRVEDGETPRQAMIRELGEELEFEPATVHWFTEIAFVMPQLEVDISHKVFFEVPVSEAEIGRMVLHEGAGCRLFDLDSLLREPRVVPWDIHALVLHARRATIFRRPGDRPPSQRLGRDEPEPVRSIT